MLIPRQVIYLEFLIHRSISKNYLCGNFRFNCYIPKMKKRVCVSFTGIIKIIENVIIIPLFKVIFNIRYQQIQRLQHTAFPAVVFPDEEVDPAEVWHVEFFDAFEVLDAEVVIYHVGYGIWLTKIGSFRLNFESESGFIA